MINTNFTFEVNNNLYIGYFESLDSIVLKLHFDVKNEKPVDMEFKNLKVSVNDNSTIVWLWDDEKKVSIKCLDEIPFYYVQVFERIHQGNTSVHNNTTTKYYLSSELAKYDYQSIKDYYTFMKDTNKITNCTINLDEYKTGNLYDIVYSKKVLDLEIVANVFARL